MSTDTQDHLVSLESTPLEVQAVVKIVGEAFNQFGRIGMTIGGKLGGRLVIIDCESGISPGLPANRIKDAASAILVKLVKLGAEMVAFWDEAWTVRSSSADPAASQQAIDMARECRLKDHPDREEVLMVTVAMPQGEWYAVAQIVRDGDMKPARLTPWQVTDTSRLHKSVGRFTGMWKQASKETLDALVKPPSAN